MSTTVSQPAKRWLEHTRFLAETIGPRGPATDGEARAISYCAEVFAGLGLRPRADRFPSAGSVFRPHIVAALGILLAFTVYPAAPWAGALLVTLVVVSEILELTQRPNPLQWVLPKRPSGNVFAVVEPSGAAARDLVLVGHLDSQRTPKIFSTPAWLRTYQAFSAVAFASFVLMAGAYLLGALLGWPWVWPASGVAAVLAVLLAAICIEAELSPFTAGANDNATAAGLVLTLAEQLQMKPLQRTRVWFLCSGSEESLHEGARHFFRTHAPGMTNPQAVVFEMLGCAGPAWLVKEGIVLPVYSTPRLRAAAEAVAAANPGLGAYPAALRGGMTEMADALAAGVPAITVIGLTPDGVGPYWHLPTDTVDKLDPAVMERNHEFAVALLEYLDSAEAGGAGRRT